MPAWARHRVGEREPKNGVRHVWCVVSAKEAWHNSDIDCVPGVYDYMFSLCCTDDGSSRNYSFDVHCIDERCDTSVMLIKLNNGDVLEFKPSEFLRRGDSYTSWNDVGDAREGATSFVPSPVWSTNALPSSPFFRVRVFHPDLD